MVGVDSNTHDEHILTGRPSVVLCLMRGELAGDENESVKGTYVNNLYDALGVDRAQIQ